MAEKHTFEGELHWTGRPTDDAHGKLKLERSFVIRFKDKEPIEGSSPAVFNGDDSRHSPETLLVSSIMACHHLTYLAACEQAGVRVLEYRDSATGTLAVKDGKMRMTEVVLWPQVRIAEPTQLDAARDLHAQAHADCFMSNSVNFEVRVDPAVTA